MVLWEITLATAYFLGLKRTYKLALRIQRRLISYRYPKIRQFAHRRTRTIFDVALKVHYKIQERDIEVGQNLGNWILRWLDRFKPSAHIRGPPPEKLFPGASSTVTTTTKQKATTNSEPLRTRAHNDSPNKAEDTGRHLFIASEKSWSRPLSGISMMRVPKPLSNMTQYRHFCLTSGGSEGVFRKDIMDWIKRS